MDPKALLLSAVIAACRAGEEVMKVYQTDFSVSTKHDKSPLTLADTNAHREIATVLSTTGLPILSEEGKNIPFSKRGAWREFWLVDPVDGTKEFITRNGEFTVNIALIENRRPVLGVIYVPVARTLYFAAKDLGAFRKTGCSMDCTLDLTLDQILAGSAQLPDSPGPRTMTVIASRSHMTEETESFIQNLRAKHTEISILSAGSSLKFCLVAEGKATIYPRFGPTMEWDTAAGHALVTMVGKSVFVAGTDTELMYNKENLKNDSFIVI